MLKYTQNTSLNMTQIPKKPSTSYYAGAFGFGLASMPDHAHVRLLALTCTGHALTPRPSGSKPKAGQIL